MAVSIPQLSEKQKVRISGSLRPVSDKQDFTLTQVCTVSLLDSSLTRHPGKANGRNTAD